MSNDPLQSLRDWFLAYCSSFSASAARDRRNFDLKREHTLRVCRNAVEIAEGLGLPGREVMVAETIALFHDIGRFPQYQAYRTFDDALSVNHAVLGARTLLELKVLRDRPARERDLIIRSVTLHNVFRLPDGLDADVLLFSRLIRDADKIDVLRVVSEYLEQDEGSRAEAVALGLPDLPGYSPEVLASLRRGEMARKDRLTTLNDFKLLLLAWMYDLNFTESLGIVRKRGLIDRISRSLPRTGEIAEAVGLVREYVERRVNGAGD